MSDCDRDDYDGFEAIRVTVDEFGLPSNVLGVSDERFFRLLGRIVPISALLESHARDVFQTLKRAPQSEYTGLGGLRLIGCITEAVANCQLSEDRETVAGFARDAKPLIARRNLYVHSMMPAKRPDAVYAWRPNPHPKDGEVKTFGEIVSADDMQADLHAMLVLVKVQRRASVSSAAAGLRPHVKQWQPR